MLAKRIIPCLDVSGGRVVKGVNFINLRDAGSIADCARRYEEDLADELVFLDITASHEVRSIFLEAVKEASEEVFMPLTVGGGVRDLEDIRSLLAAGADKVSVNSAALKEPDFVGQAARRFGSQCIVVAIDARRRLPERWDVYVHGGRIPTGREAINWAREAESRGAGEILLTSMDADGTIRGYDLELTRRVVEAVSIPVIASGGAGGPEEIYQVLTAGQADAALAASIFHYRQYTVRQIKEYLGARRVAVRG